MGKEQVNAGSEFMVYVLCLMSDTPSSGLDWWIGR